MRLVVNKTGKINTDTFGSYDFVNRKRRVSLPKYQVGGEAPNGMEEMPAEATAAPANEGQDIQAMMKQFAQSQDPNVAIQILQMLAQPETASDAVNMIMQAMQGGATQKQGEESEVPAAKHGMDFNLESNLFDEIYKEVLGSK